MSDRFEAAESLAALAATPEDIDAITAAIRLIIARDQKFPAGEEIRSLTGLDISTKDLDDLLFRLADAGVIGEKEVSRAALDQIESCAVLLVERGAIAENDIVINTPTSEDDELGRSFGSLVVRWMELVREADQRVVVLNPFFTLEVFDRVAGPLTSIAERGISIDIVTRSVTRDERNQNARFMERLFEQNPIREQTTVYEYVEDDSIYSPTIHAKLTLVDDSAAYLGTANLTHRGLFENLELGVIFRDDTVIQLTRFVDELFKSRFIEPLRYEPETGTFISSDGGSTDGF